MNGEEKITVEHRSRQAVIYLRQSSDGQVRHNLESQRLQYALADRARALGFPQVEVVDCDLGFSAAVAAKRREGFERLLGTVALGQVGIIMSRELSRLLRTDKDFCQLVEICQVFGTLIGDEETIYDTTRMDDQLVLGIKATLSVVELKVLRMRLQQGKENKARRGEYYPNLPAGYVRDATKKVVKDPNLRVQESIAMVFAKFQESWSIRQTFKWFLDHNVQLPVNKPRQDGLTVVFQLPRQTYIQYVLHSPFYAGAFVWGRRTTEVVWRDGTLRKRMSSCKPPEEARVFIRDHHEGYIDWATFEENQRMIEKNNWRGESDERAGAARSGNGLVSGLLRCGRCGRRLQVRYWGASGTAARYVCTGDYTGGGSRYCIGFGGRTADQRLSQEILRVVSPLGVQASLAALERLDTQQEEQQKAIGHQAEQLEYEAQRAFEQYDEVDPRNRLVAQELEKRWNVKLDELERVRASLVEVESRRHLPTEEERTRIRELGERYSEVWNHPACPMELKKQIVRLLIEEILVDENPPGRLSFIVHWKGGSHTAFEMEKPNPKTLSRTAEEDLEVIRRMAPRYGDDDIARVLSKLGRCTGKGKPWSKDRVKTARINHGIEGRTHTKDDPEVLTLQGAERYTNTSDTTIKKLVEWGVLPMTQAAPFAPWEIRRADLDSDRVRTILEHLKTTGRLEKGDTLEDQGELFQ